MNALHATFPVEVLCLASPIYWNNQAHLETSFERIKALLDACAAESSSTLDIRLIQAEAEVPGPSEGAPQPLRILLPMSGGVQPWLLRAASSGAPLALLNAYLPDILEASDAHALMHRNAHPSCTDFYAHCRLRQRDCVWLDSRTALTELLRGWVGAQRLRHARLLKIGETEPWVINSCRDPARFAERWGTEIVPLERSALYAAMEQAPAAAIDRWSANWIGSAQGLAEVGSGDVREACRVVAGMEELLQAQNADGLSIACFAMIGDADTTSCLALSTLNDSANAIGACEGDLDAAVTLFLLRAMGADFVWIGNPIFHPGTMMELAHCTAPRCACGHALPYRLMRHHESGRGVAPEVSLPADEVVTLVRIGDNLTKLALHGGRTRCIGKLPTCHTQIQIEVDDTQRIRDHLLGTHLIMSYGDWRPALRHAARFLGLEIWPEERPA